MHCPDCGANLPDDALYCGMCGKRLDEEDPALSSRASMIGGPPTGLTGPLPSLSEEELTALLRGQETEASEELAAPYAEGTENEEPLDFGESAEVGRGEEFGRKDVSFEGIYNEGGEKDFQEDLTLNTEELLAAGPAGQAVWNGEGEAGEPAPGGTDKKRAGTSAGEPDGADLKGAAAKTPDGAGREGRGTAGTARAGFGRRDAKRTADGGENISGDGEPPADEGGWKRTILISFLAIAATVALVFWTVHALSGKGGKDPGALPVTPTMAESRGSESDSSGTSKTESGISGDSGAESTAAGTGSTASADSKAESRGADSPGTESDQSGTSKTDSSDESHGGRRRVTATPTPTLLPTLSPTPRPTKTPTPAPKTDVDFIRQALGDKNAVLLYVSDAGSAWHTELTLRNDATFTGSYEESVVEIAGDHEMIVRNCTFTGHVYDCKKLKNGTYSMKIKVRMNGSEGESHLEGKKRYVTARPRGLNSDDEIILYPPGTSTEGLNEGLLGWLRRARGSDITSAQLPCYCILDLNTGYGFGEYGK